MQTTKRKSGAKRSADTPAQELVLAQLKGRKSVTIADLAESTDLEERQVRASIDRLRRAGYRIPRTELCTVELKSEPRRSTR